jgi:Cu+-exporting ATPase
MMVDEKRATYRSEHDGMAFYFCSAGCKSTFDRDPHRYAHRM